MRRALVLAIIGFAVATAQTTDENDIILRAMRDEMERSRKLRIVGGGDAPYFFSYTLSDADSFRAYAQMGALVAAARNHFRAPNIEVRVGNYDFDNTGHVFSGFFTGTRFDTDAWPLDDLYDPLRECFWLGTDRAFKTSLESMARKKAALNSAAAPAEKLADYSAASPVKSLAKVTRSKIDEGAWTRRAVELSALFKGIPEILASSVEAQALDGVTYLMNSEGTTLRYLDNLATVTVKAEGQAPDGMLLHDGLEIQALELNQIPSDPELRKHVAGVAENIRALVHAPLGESYSGPVLFEPAAAGQLLAQLLGENLRLPRKPVAEPGRPVNFLPSEFETKVGSRILPDWIDVLDDPKQTKWNGKPLAGFYEFDLEGVPGEPVSLVEKGVLKRFLTTRQPVKGSTASNGHARLPGSYGARSASIGNLFIKAAQSAPLASLKQKLMEQIKDRGKPYGILVRKLDYPFSAGFGELQALAQASSQSGGSVRPVSPPILIYRVYPDGREELVRGLRFRGLSTRALRDIMAASEETGLFEFVNTSGPLAMMGSGGYLAPTSVVAPGLLFEELELERPSDQLPKLPLVPPPSGR
jgi:hypothetical protein